MNQFWKMFDLFIIIYKYYSKIFFILLNLDGFEFKRFTKGVVSEKY